MKAVIFDLDGTLVESLPGIAEALNRLMKDLGREPYALSEVRGFIGDGMWMLIRRALPAEEFSDAEVSKLLTPFQDHYADVWKAGTEPYEGVMEMLQNLQKAGIQTGVLSNKMHSFTVEIGEALFGRDLLPLIYGQREGVEKKPAPDALLSICEELKCSPEEVIYVGDSTVDLETARNAGAKGIGVLWGYHDTERLKPYGFDLCSTMPELEQGILNQ